MNKKLSNTKRITVSAMTAALGVVILYLGSFIEVLDISVAVLASMLSLVIVIEYGKAAPYSIYAATSILSLLLLPQKLPALMYTLFFGYYPIVKESIERLRNRILQWSVKLCIFSAAIALFLWLSSLFAVDLDIPAGKMWLAVFIALAALTLVLYDVALTRVVSFYIIRLRHRFRKLF